MVIVVLVHHENIVLHQKPPIQTTLIIKHGLEVLVALESHLQLLFLNCADLLRQRFPLIVLHFVYELLKPILKFFQVHISQVKLLLVAGELGQVT